MKVTKSDKTQKGKPYVCFDGKHNWTDYYYLGRDVERPEVGVIIEANTSSKTFEDGKVIWFLNGWKPLAQKPASVALAQELQQPPRKSNGGWDIQSGDLSRFASNVIGSAIAAKLIMAPDDVFTWAAAAYRAGEQLRSGKIQDFNDWLPDGVTVTEATPEEFEEEIPF